MTQKELAEKIGKSPGHIAHLEQGKREPGWQVVQALAAALGVGCEDFMGTPPDEGPKRGRKKQ